MLTDSIKPGHSCIYNFEPLISDLRTGAMTGGSGEAAVASAAAAQLLNDLGLPSAVSAGITDSKVADIQAGYEKAYTVALSAHAGASMVQLAVGMLGSIMVASSESLVIDDEMCGAILRSNVHVGTQPHANWLLGWAPGPPTTETVRWGWWSAVECCLVEMISGVR